MANYTDPYAVNETTTGGTVDNITLTNPAQSEDGRAPYTNDPGIVVLNMGTVPLYGNYVLGVTPASTPPTVGGQSCFVVPASWSRVLPISEGPYTVSIISTSACAYSIEGV